MDKYEKEFLERIKQMAKEIVVDRIELAELRLKRFVAMIYFLISEKHEKFDVIVGGGNSGVAVTEIVKLVYEQAGIKLPPIVVLPIVRPSNQSNITIEKDTIHSQLKNIEQCERVLFVDDEIMRGQTAKLCFEMIRDVLGEKKVNPCLSCTIVAENHLFVWRYDTPDISLRFLPFATVLQGYNGNFGYLIPEGFASNIALMLGEPIDRNKIFALLLGGKIKKVTENKAFFEFPDNKALINKIPNYLEERQKFISRIELLVKCGIEEYKRGEIQFRYLP